MRRRPLFISFAIAAVAAVVLAVASSCSSYVPVCKAPAQPASGVPDLYTSQVQPIFCSNCYRCHAGLNHRGGLTLDTRAALMRGGKKGIVVVPGHPEQSLLIKLIRHEGPPKDPMPMPPKSKLSDAEIAVITEWVKEGAKME